MVCVSTPSATSIDNPGADWHPRGQAIAGKNGPGIAGFPVNAGSEGGRGSPGKTACERTRAKKDVPLKVHNFKLKGHKSLRNEKIFRVAKIAFGAIYTGKGNFFFFSSGTNAAPCNRSFARQAAGCSGLHFSSLAAHGSPKTLNKGSAFV